MARDLEGLIRYLVDDRDAVVVTESRERRDGTLFLVDVAQRDLGKVIGRQGRTARALRSLLEVRGDNDGRHYGLEICDP